MWIMRIRQLTLAIPYKCKRRRSIRLRICKSLAIYHRSGTAAWPHSGREGKVLPERGAKASIGDPPLTTTRSAEMSRRKRGGVKARRWTLAALRERGVARTVSHGPRSTPPTSPLSLADQLAGRLKRGMCSFRKNSRVAFGAALLKVLWTKPHSDLQGRGSEHAASKGTRDARNVLSTNLKLPFNGH